jgi:hypothetical protein
MRVSSSRMTVFLLATFALSLGTARANDFSVYFTNSDTGNSVVGRGVFSFSGSYGDGTYLLSSLANYNIDFTVDGETFTNSDIDTQNLSHVEVVIDDNGRDFYFNTNCTSGPDCYGYYNGSLDFTDPNNSNFELSTEPNYAGAPPLNGYFAAGPDGESSGMYQGTPEPEPLWLLGTGMVALMIRRFRLT